MNRELIALVAALWLVAAGSTIAQDLGKQTSPAGGPPALQGGGGSARDLRPAQMYEDVEVLRRILNRTLDRVYGLPSASVGKEASNDFYWLNSLPAASTSGHQGMLSPADASQSNVNALWGQYFVSQQDPRTGKTLVSNPFINAHSGSSPHAFAGAEGTYVKGAGVVYSVTMPLPLGDLLPAPAQPEPKPLSQWERTRKELRGEKVEATESNRVRRDLRLADALLRVLADNGHNFGQLAENEQVIVAVTFRGQTCSVCHATSHSTGGGTGTSSGGKPVGMSGMSSTGSIGGGPTMGGGGLKGSSGGIFSGTTRSSIGTSGSVGTSTQSGNAFGAPGGQPSATFPTQDSELQNYVLLGELHLKQGRGKEAVDAFQKAVEAHQGAVRKEDAEFIRRIYLDVTGAPPPADALRLQSFLSDKDAHKRSKLVDRLVKGPEGAAGRWSKEMDQRLLQRDLTTVELYTRLAQAYLSMGKKEEAHKMLELVAGQARGVEELAQAPRGTAAGSNKPAAAAPGTQLPPKLIVAAPKKLLDEVGSGKMSFEDFKKAATVQYLTFPAQEKGNKPEE